MTVSSSDLVAAFLAKGGKVAKVAPDAGAGLTGRDWALATRGIESSRNSFHLKGATDRAENRAERQMETFHESRFAGASVSQALDDMASVRY